MSRHSAPKTTVAPGSRVALVATDEKYPPTIREKRGGATNHIRHQQIMTAVRFLVHSLVVSISLTGWRNTSVRPLATDYYPWKNQNKKPETFGNFTQNHLE